MRAFTYLITFAIFFLISCTAQPQLIQPCIEGEAAGFFHGIWHGIISPFTFVISLFSDKIEVFEVNNNGVWYVFGFLLGVGAFTSSSVSSARKVKFKKKY